ncbi:MAG TPA: CAP domain-containing protein [Polyangiaceae bacterium]
MQRFLHGFLLVSCIASTAGCGNLGGTAQLPPFGSGLPKISASPEVHSLEHRMSELVNRDRRKHGLPPLVYDERLADVGRAHSADMQKHHFFDHESPTFGRLEHRLARAGYLYVTSRENLAEAPDIEEAEQGLLKSPHHFENLMATDIASIGIGIVKGGVQDPRNLLVTQVFSTPGKSENDAQALHNVMDVIQVARGKGGLKALPRLPALDNMAQGHLSALKSDLSEGQLRPVAKAVAEQLAKKPIAKVTRISVSGQVVVDSSQFQVQGALLESSARGYGIAVGHELDSAGAKRLKVLVLVGL